MSYFKKIISSLYVQVLTAIVIGVLLGTFQPQLSVAMKPFGDGFIKLIKMLIAPIIFCSVVLGIAGVDAVKKLGKTGGLAMLYFELVSVLALIVGLIMINLFHPGSGMNVNVKELDATAITSFTQGEKPHSTIDFLLNIIPSTMIDAFAKGEILQVLLISILFGFALQSIGGKKTVAYDLLEKVSGVLFGMIGIVMRVAPLGAFGAMAFTIGKYGLGSLLSLGKLMGTFYLTCFIFVFGVLGLIAKFHGFSIWRLIKYIKEDLFIVLGTSSSEVALPGIMQKLEKAGAQKSVVGLVIPAGYSFNLDGTSIYLTMAAVFIAQATNTPMDLLQQITLLAVLTLTSKGAAGVTGSGFVVLAATLSSVGNVPVAGLALILGIDRFMSEARALTNLIGNSVATLVVAKWTDDLDSKKLTLELSGQAPHSGEKQK